MAWFMLHFTFVQETNCDLFIFAVSGIYGSLGLLVSSCMKFLSVGLLFVGNACTTEKRWGGVCWSSQKM